MLGPDGACRMGPGVFTHWVRWGRGGATHALETAEGNEEQCFSLAGGWRKVIWESILKILFVVGSSSFVILVGYNLAKKK